MSSNTTQKTASDFLEHGKEVLQERGKTYDKDNNQQERSMSKVVQVFKIITGKELTEAEGWQFMACLKQVRAFQKEDFHEDSWQDGINYLALGAEAARAAWLPKVKDPWDNASIQIHREIDALNQNLTPLQSHAWYMYDKAQQDQNKLSVAWNALSEADRSVWLMRVQGSLPIPPAPNL